MELAHSRPMAGHLGVQNTIQRIRDRFHWPGLDTEVKRFCQACPTCQRMSPRTPPPSPLISLPIIEVPFKWIGMDLVGPLPKSAQGQEHILVIVDYATRYPEAIPLWKATAKAIAQELFLLCSRVGIPAEILTDQGTPFMSRLMVDLCRLLKVKQLRTMIYHPQTDGLVERFNQTLKQMLRCVAAEDRWDWDQMLPYVLFGIREVPQTSTGFTSFELLFGRQPRGLFGCRKRGVGAAASWPSVVDRACPFDAGEGRQSDALGPGTPQSSAAGPTTPLRSGGAATGVPTGRPRPGPGPQRGLQVLGHLAGAIYRDREGGPGHLQGASARAKTGKPILPYQPVKNWIGTRTQLSALATSSPVVVDMEPQLSAT
uniref:Gypsy retrotransposon integrase-like protein 1 n=1 Tax=Cyprinus carpio carpio TaxID=630221 RepID=A0A9J8CRS1_CYPCA